MNFRDRMQIVGWLCAIAALIMILGGVIAKAQVPFSDIDATGYVTIDIISSCNGLVLRNPNGEAKLIDLEKNTVTIFQLPKLPSQSICWFSKAILIDKKIWAVMINSVEGADYRCQIYDIKGNKYLDVDGQGGPPNNKFLQIRSYNRVRVYKTADLKIIPVNVIPKVKVKPLKVVLRNDDMYDPRGIVVPKGLLPSGLYVKFGTNKIIFVK